MGAGIIGTSIARRLASSGADVCLVERSGAAAGTSSAGEGNLLVSDKLPGPEISLALRGLELWRQLADRAGDAFEFEPKGGLVVAGNAEEMSALAELAGAQAAQGVKVELANTDGICALEPALSRRLVGGAFYPQDAQVQPMLAVDYLLKEMLRCGGHFVPGTEVLGWASTRPGAKLAVRTDRGDISVGRCVINAAGPWSGEVARRLGGHVQVQPRRGHILVTEPLPALVHHKVYEAGYVGSIHQQAPWTCSTVIEATASGTMLLGSSREMVGFSERPQVEVMAEIAARAISVVPVLGGVRLMRTYTGFRPVTPDRLPLIGPDLSVEGLVHASGHEGAGVGLAEVTAELVEAIVLARPTSIDLEPFFPGRPFPAEASETPLSRPVRPRAVTALPPPRPEVRGQATGRLDFDFEGRPLSAPAGATVAGALLQSGQVAWRTARQDKQRRGIFCGIGTCFDCLVDINEQKGLRACLTPLRAGDHVKWSASLGPGWPAAGKDGPRASGSGSVEADVAVVGAGPAGMAAALAATERGARVVMVDTSPMLGGQYFRQTLTEYPAQAAPAPLSRAPSVLPARFRRLTEDALVSTLLGREVWWAEEYPGGFRLGLSQDEPGLVHCRSLVLATGASELVLPFPGWELPGVLSAGAVQALLKSQNIALGPRVVIGGTGPFLLPVAASLARAGARVVVVEAARPGHDLGALSRLLGHPAKLAEAGGYLATLARHRAQVLMGHGFVRCEGTSKVERVVVARLGPDGRAVAGTEKAIAADAVGVSYGFVPRVELARQLGAQEQFALSFAGRPKHPGRQVVVGPDMATSVPGLFVAGELAGVAGAEVAELEGALAGHAAASFIGLPERPAPARPERGGRLARGRAFASVLGRLYPTGTGFTTRLSGRTIFCRCEQVPWSEVRAAIAAGANTAREVRNVTRCGMGYCQGRTCGPALQLSLAALTGMPMANVGDLHKRSVAVPVDLSRVAELAHPGAGAQG